MDWRRWLALAVALAGAATAAADETSSAGGRGQGTMGSGMFITDVFSYRGCHRPQLDLSGEWEFRRDADGKGEEQGWHRGEGEFTESVTVPGAPQAQGIGEPHERQQHWFAEPFWVRRTFRLPELGKNQRVWLRIGGIVPAAEIYLNGSRVGYTQSSRTQQRVDVTPWVTPDGENLIAVKVCDYPEVRLDGLYEMQNLTVMWTGVYRPILCEITDRTCIVDAYLQPRLSTGSVLVDVTLSEPAAAPLDLAFHVKDGADTIGQATVRVPHGDTQAHAEVKLDRFTPWSPQHPALYTLDIALIEGGRAEPADRAGIRFGMREITTQGARFYLNGKPLLLRCYGDDQYYPETLCPPSDVDWYLERLRRARAYGMNAVKSCVEVLPQEYVEAADEAGIMVIQEMPFGLSDLRTNRNTIDERFRRYYAAELDGLVRQSRNHASVLFYSMSSEMEFDNQTQESFDFFSRDLVEQTRALAPHALVVDCTGYFRNNFEQTSKGRRHTDFYVALVPTRKDVLEEFTIKGDGLHPTIFHEYYWWSCYPNPEAGARYANAQAKPFWLDTLVKTARENGQAELIPTYHKNSLWLQALCRKDGVEFVRRNPDVSGYILWLLIDLGQWSEGLLDDFWEPKNVSAEEYLKSNGDTVVVLAHEETRCLTMAAPARIPLAVDHYGEESLRGCTIEWKATRGDAFQGGTLAAPELRPGELTQGGAITLRPPEDETAYKFEVQVVLRHDGEVVNTNDWSFWAFPETRPGMGKAARPENAGRTIEGGVLLRIGPAARGAIPEGVPLVVADSVDEALADYVSTGGRCLLFTRGAVIENAIGGPGRKNLYRFFGTIPWNVGTYGNSGTVISPHPALAAFPHEGMCDLQFISMLRGLLPMEFSPLRPYGVTPIIRGIDHYAAHRNNAMMLEFGVERGKVFVTSLGVLQNLDEHVEARCLLQCLLDYAQGARFDPVTQVPGREFLRLFADRPAAAEGG